MAGHRPRGACSDRQPRALGLGGAVRYTYILGHDGVWNTTADDIADYYLTNYYDQVSSWIAERKVRT